MLYKLFHTSEQVTVKTTLERWHYAKIGVDKYHALSRLITLVELDAKGKISAVSKSLVDQEVL